MRHLSSFLTLVFVVFNDYAGFACTITLFAPLLYGPSMLEGNLATKSITLGFLLASYPLAQLCSAPFIGTLSDRFGRKPILLTTLLTSALFYFLVGVAIDIHSLSLLFISRVLGGVTAGNVSTAQAAIVDRSYPDTKARNISYVTAAIGLGFFAGSVGSGRLSDYSFAFPFYLIAAFFLLNWILLIFFVSHSSAIVRNYHNHFFRLLIKPPLNRLFGAFLLTALAFNSFSQIGSAFLSLKFSFTPAHIGDTYGMLVGGLVCATLWLFKRMFRYLSLHRIILVALASTCVVSLFCTITTLPWTFYLLFFLFGMGNGLFNAAVYPSVSNSAPCEDQGSAFGILLSLNSLAQVLAPLLIGPLLAFHPDIPFLLSSSALFLALLVHLIFL